MSRNFQGAQHLEKMKPDQLYQELIDLAERLQITVSEQNLKATGVKVKSGLCKVRGQHLFVMDKHKSIHDKIRLLAEQLADMPHENIYMVPAIRELLNKYVTKSKPAEGRRSEKSAP